MIYLSLLTQLRVALVFKCQLLFKTVLNKNRAASVVFKYQHATP